MAEGKFVTAVNCMDGRVQEPVISYMKEKYGADYVDMITSAGPIKTLDEQTETDMVEFLRRHAGISAEKHGSKVIAIVGHFDCAGNPVDKERQLKQIESSMKLAESWGFGFDIVGLWVDENLQTSRVF